MNSVNCNGESVTPSKVLCVGRNYAKHVAELNNAMPDQMVVFFKPNASVATTLTAFHEEAEEALHYEGEISFIVKGGQLYGVGFGLDLTKRGLQSQLKEKQLPWERAKAFTGSAVFDRFVLLPLFPECDFSLLNLELLIDGERAQYGGVSEMLFTPEEILNDLLSFTTLEDGDIIMTGTPAGVGPVSLGALFTGRIFYSGELLVESSWLAK